MHSVRYEKNYRKKFKYYLKTFFFCWIYTSLASYTFYCSQKKIIYFFNWEQNTITFFLKFYIVFLKRVKPFKWCVLKRNLDLWALLQHFFQTYCFSKKNCIKFILQMNWRTHWINNFEKAQAQLYFQKLTFYLLHDKISKTFFCLLGILSNADFISAMFAEKK